MSPQARAKLPPELGRLTRKDMEAVIYQANLGRENEKIAQLYSVDKLPQVDVATELFLGRATVQRRLPEIMCLWRRLRPDSGNSAPHLGHCTIYSFLVINAALLIWFVNNYILPLRTSSRNVEAAQK